MGIEILSNLHMSWNFMTWNAVKLREIRRFNILERFCDLVFKFSSKILFEIVLDRLSNILIVRYFEPIYFEFSKVLYFIFLKNFEKN